MKTVVIMIGIFIASIILFNIVGGVLGASTNEEEMVGIIVLCIQNSVIISLLIYIAGKLRKNR